MDEDTMPLPTHVTWRGTTLQYVRRVPDDVAARFGQTRIQRSLRTRDPLIARAKALELDRAFENRFLEVRSKQGPIDPVLGTETWILPDWQLLADWFKASRIEEDTLRRATTAIGGDSTRRSKDIPFDDRIGGVFHSEIAIVNASSTLTSIDWYKARGEVLRKTLAILGVKVPETLSHWPIISLYFQRADSEAAELIMDRERGNSRSWISRDEVTGPWQRKPSQVEAALEEKIIEAESASSPAPGAIVGNIRSLQIVQQAWSADRMRNNKPVDDRAQHERLRSIERFIAHSGKANIAEITRGDILNYRDWRHDEQNAAPGTANKEISVISSLLRFAKGRDWIASIDLEDMHLATPEGDGDIEPFSDSELELIFNFPIFSDLKFDSEVKACGALQYWLPIISASHGMISSEIMRLGPDTVVGHPEHPHILCFNVTTANGRRVKSLARRRYVPVHQKLIDLGFLDIVEAAKSNKQRYLWAAVDKLEVSRSSQYFSDWFSRFLRKKVGIIDERKRLYSCRHAFKDRLKKIGVSKEHRDMLMGHAESGTGAGYGTKRDPEPVPIEALSDAIQRQSLHFLDKATKFKL